MVLAQQTDTQKAITAVEAALVALKTGTGDLITADITGLEATLENLKAKAEAEAAVLATKVKTEIADIETKEATWSESFRTKHGVSWQVAFIGGAFVLWQAGSAIARALGVI
jgi:hypothetical protein